jgi:hypothetical protein
MLELGALEAAAATMTSQGTNTARPGDLELPGSALKRLHWCPFWPSLERPRIWDLCSLQGKLFWGTGPSFFAHYNQAWRPGAARGRSEEAALVPYFGPLLERFRIWDLRSLQGK